MITRIIKFLISSLFYLLQKISSFINLFNSQKSFVCCIVLYYHGIGDDQRRSFDRQMALLKKYTIPIHVFDLKKMKKGERYSIVTFDDGFISVISNALPILLKHSIPSIIFIPTAYIGKSPEWMVLKNENIEIKKLDTVINQEQMKKIICDPLVHIGSHSETHCNFLMVSEKQAEKEIFNSKKVLESLLKINIDSFSFPHGEYAQKHIEYCRKAGYKYIFSISPKLVDSKSVENIMGRFNVKPDDTRLEFYLKIMGAYSWLPLAFVIKERIKKFFKNFKNNYK